MNENKQAAINAIWANPSPAFGGCGFYARGAFQENQAGEAYKERGKIRIRLTASGNNITVFYNGDSREEQSDVFTYVGQYHLGTGGDFKRTLEELARLYNLPLEWTEKERQALRLGELAREAAAVLIESLRKHPDGVAAKYINQRGFSTDGVHFGELTEDSAREVAAVLKSKGKKFNAEDLAALGITTGRANAGYNCVLPYYTNGQIQGFVYRNVRPNIPDKDRYRDSRDLGQPGFCDALERGGRAIIVEGQLDALRLIKLGYKNVIGLGGRSLSSEIARLLKSFNITEAVYIPDHETDATGARTNTKTVQDAIKGILAAKDDDGRPILKGLEVADLPVPATTKAHNKNDADEYGKTQPDDLGGLIELGAVPAWSWELDRLSEQTANKRKTQIQADFEEIYSRYPSPLERQLISREIGNRADEFAKFGITPEGLANLDAWRKSREYNDRIKAAAEELSKAVKAEANPATVAEIVRRLAEAQRSDTRADWEQQLQTPFEMDLAAIQAQPDTIATKWQLYYYRKGENTPTEGERVEFWPADITIFCAATSHGKTSILVQTALDLIKSTDKTYLYISVEENRRQLLERFLNVYLPIGTEWPDKLNQGKNSAGNYCFKRGTRKRAIKSALRGHTSNKDYRPEIAGNNEHFAALAEMIRRGVADYKTKVAPRLLLIHTDASAESIADNIKFYADRLRNEGRDVGAVFLDYMQLLTAEGDEYSRHDEIKSICKALKECAAQTELPLVIASQLNRNALKNNGAETGIDALTVANIAEGADIERIAHDIYLLWQVDKTPLQSYRDSDGGTDEKKVKRGLRSARLFEETSKTNPAPILKSGYLYIEQLKARDGQAGGWGLLPYDGEAGTIGATDQGKTKEYK